MRSGDRSVFRILVTMALIVGVLTTAAQTSSAQTPEGWVLAGPPVLSPSGGVAPYWLVENPIGSVVAEWIDLDDPPLVKIEGTYDTPPSQFALGEAVDLNVSLTGSFTGGTDHQGFLQLALIFVQNRSRIGPSVFLNMECPDRNPAGCTPPDQQTADGKFTINAPTSGTKFTVTFGVFGCTFCEIEWTYERGEVADKPITEGPSPTVLTRMGDRYGKKSADGVVRPTSSINPRQWPVTVVVKRANGKACKGKDRATAKIAKAKSVVRRNRCTFDVTFFDEGTYPGTFTLDSRGKVGKTKTDVVVQDWLIIGIGDSNGSGEGTPDIPKFGTAEPVWVDQCCDRSGNSHQARAARKLEKSDKSSSVTFVHLACSGAEIDSGLLRGYEGIISAQPDLTPQMRVVKRLAKKREVDALLISIGVNDLKFGPMVSKCIERSKCFSRSDVKGGKGKSLDDGMKKRLAALPRLYKRLAREIKRAKIDPSRVYITQYFDSTKDQAGRTCDPLISVGASPASLDFDREEAQWAHDSVLAPLNEAVAAAAAKHGWNLISGSEELFAKHGYCSNKSWIVSLTESISRQGDQNGTLHSTRKGNDEQAALVVPSVRADFYQNGQTRNPKS